MQEIREIVRIIARRKVKRVETVFSLSKSKTKQLYDLVRSGSVVTDHAAILAIYGEENEANRSAYFKLKHNLKRRLLNSVFFIDVSDSNFSPLEREMFEATRAHYEVIFLIRKSAFSAGIRIAEKYLKKAEELEMWALGAGLSQILRRIFSTYRPDLKKFRHYKELTRRYQETEVAVSEAESMFWELASQLIQTVIPTPDLVAQAKQYEAQAREMTTPFPAGRLRFYQDAIPAFRMMVEFKYHDAAKWLRRAIKRLEETDVPSSRNYLVSFLNNLIRCDIYIRNFKEGQANIRRALEYVVPYSFNWFQTKSTEMVLALHSRAYSRMLPIYEEVTGHRYFRKMAPIYKEVWRLYLACMKVFHKMGKLSLPDKYFAPIYDMEKVLLNVRHLQKDKSGYNVNVRVLQLIWWQVVEDYDKIFSTEEGIKRYRSRYLLSDVPMHRRSNLLLEYMIHVMEHDFDLRRCQEKKAEIAQAFKKAPMFMNVENYDIEVIPFDVAFDIVNELMRNNPVR